MTETKKPNYEIIPEKFNKKEIEIIKKGNEIWMTAETIGVGLEYKNPRKSIMNLYYSHKDELEEFTSVIESMTEAGTRQTTIFNEQGIYLLIMFSNQPLAKDFRRWIIGVIKDIRQKGFYIAKTKQDPFDLFIQQAEMIKESFLQLKEQKEKINLLESKIDNVNTEVKQFEQRYDDEKKISSETLRKIRDIIRRTHDTSGLHWNTVWSIVFRKFGLSNIKNATEKIGLRVLLWLQTNPDFYKEQENQDQ
ncbi:MAG: Bro-N domain-containing protein [Promethearchaeota archaeon]